MPLKYRPEIEGLRAIAVISVVFYHADFLFMEVNPFQGGFIGVDIFFVISGYLITSIILRELGNGSFSLTQFYERRARRILPALFTVMVATIPLAYFQMLPKAMKEYAGSGLSAMIFGSNFWFWQEDSYNAEPSALKPLLHTWSLSVEEQFYILFPISLLLLWKFAGRHITTFFTVTLLFSLQWAQYGSSQFADATFYLIPSRGWELLAGAILAKRELDFGRPDNTMGRKVLPPLGILLIASSVFLFNDQMPHPSYLTVIPVVGTMLIIWFCKTGEFVTDTLSTRPFIAIGLVSYSFYLWHYPIFAFSKLNNLIPTQIEKLGLIILALVISVATFFLIEKPSRNRKLIALKPFSFLLTISFLALTLTFVNFYKTDGATYRFKNFSTFVNTDYKSENIKNKHLFFTYDGCYLGQEDFSEENPFHLCLSKEKQAPGRRNILVIGDSHASGLIPGLIKAFGREAIAERVIAGCRPLLNYHEHFDREHHAVFCLKSVKQAYSEIERLKPDLIIIGGRYMEISEAKVLSEMFLGPLSAYKSKILLMGPLPRWMPGGLPNLLLTNYKKNPNKTLQNFPDTLTPHEKTFALEKAFSTVAEEAGVGYLSPVGTFCAEDKCLTKIGNSPDSITAFDYAHLTHLSSFFLIRKNLDKIQKFMD